MFVSENKYNDLLKKNEELKYTIHRINNDRSMAYKRVNRLERENFDLKVKIAKLEGDNTVLTRKNKELANYKNAFYARGLTVAKLRDRIEKLDKVKNDKNDCIDRLEDSITEICEAKDELQRMCNDRYHLVKKYQERCEWYSACLRKDRELIRQLREELEHKANFMCKPFLKEHEDMKKDFEYVLNGAVFYSPEYLHEYFDELHKKWFAYK